MKRVSYTLAFVLAAFVTFSSAAQIQGFFTGYAPSIVDEYKTVRGVEKYSELHSDFMWSLGGEFLVNPVGPLMVGGGLGFFSVQQDGDVNVVMPSVPLWGSVGVIGPETWTARPYLEFRVGYPVPAARFATWWDKPLNFFATGAIGVQLPYHMGVEFDYTYITMDKYFKKHDVNFRLDVAKFGGSITVHFDLSGSAAAPAAEPAKKADVVVPAGEFSSETSSDVIENQETSEPEEQTYSSDFSEQSAEESSEEAAEESAAEETFDNSSVEDSSEAGAAEEESVAEESAAEEAPVEESVAEEPVAEVPAEENAEPVVAPEPKPEPASAPAAKKASSKKSAKNAKAKKNTKKAKAKKSTKKGKTAKKAAKKPGKKKAAAKKKVES